MPVDPDKFKQFQKGFNSALGGQPDETEEERKKREAEERKAKSLLRDSSMSQSYRASQVLKKD
jgi:hypothetical protein